HAQVYKPARPGLQTLCACRRLCTHGSRLSAHGSRLTAHGSRLSVLGSGSEKSVLSQETPALSDLTDLCRKIPVPWPAPWALDEPAVGSAKDGLPAWNCILHPPHP